MNFSRKIVHHRVSYVIVLYILKKGCTNPGHQVTWAIKFCMVVPIICEPSVWNFEVARRLLENLCPTVLKCQTFFHKA
jgi:hypothetical protein